MKLTITSVDYSPKQLHDQLPLNIKLIRQVPGPDRPDYWLGEAEQPINWWLETENIERQITHVVIAARWEGTRIAPHVENLPIGIAYVVDMTLLDEPAIDLNKCKYIAIGLATETEGGRSPRLLTKPIGGRITKAFGTGG